MSIGVGDVVLVDNSKKQYVVVFIKNNEDMSIMREDKVYFVAQIDTVNSDNYIFDLINAIPIKMQGPNPEHTLTLVENEAPFVIKHVEAVRILRRKVAKTITVYE